jgi:hypothetical protein
MKTRKVPQMSDRDVKRFWNSVDVRTEDECWNWKKHTTKPLLGYGLFRIGSSKYTSNRVAYTIANGEIRDNLLVTHTCDNSICCNPKHLVLGSQYDNVRRMMELGRNRYSPLHGEESPNAKLTECQVKEIREMSDRGIAQTVISKLFGVSQSNISMIKNKKTWVA